MTLNRILLAALLAALAGSASAQRPVDRVAAVVNGEVITLSELTQRAGAEYRRATDMPPGIAREQARSRALRTAYDSRPR